MFPAAAPLAGSSNEAAAPICGFRSGVSIAPRKGDAVLFWSQMLVGGVDANATHASCPVVSGSKWTATLWMRATPFKGGDVVVTRR